MLSEELLHHTRAWFIYSCSYAMPIKRDSIRFDLSYCTTPHTVYTYCTPHRVYTCSGKNNTPVQGSFHARTLLEREAGALLLPLESFRAPLGSPTIFLVAIPYNLDPTFCKLRHRWDLSLKLLKPAKTDGS